MSADGQAPLLRLDGVTCARGGRRLFEGLSLALAPGEAAVVTGPNGAGKSSLLRLTAGLLRPAEGRVEAVSAALLAEAAALDSETSVRANLRFWGRLDGVTPAAVETALDAMALRPLADAPVRLLSTGQRRRAALARVLASGRRLWLLDEPANGLDTDSVALLERAIVEHRAGGGAAVVATHAPIALPQAQAVRLG